MFKKTAAQKDIKPVKMEKTSEHTFNMHLDDGSYAECKSKAPLSKLGKTKSIEHSPSSGKTFSGIGESRGLVCGRCTKVVLRVRGMWNKKFRKLVYLCDNCTMDDFNIKSEERYEGDKV